jgi:hypothetical protein
MSTYRTKLIGFVRAIASLIEHMSPPLDEVRGGPPRLQRNDIVDAKFTKFL